VLVAVRQQGRLLGRIQINLQGGARSPSTPNLTVSARELPVDDAAAGIPVAMISCRFSTRGTTGLLNLQNAHSLLHEFGHAINHVQLSHRAGSSSGLDNLPVERLELMSMWFERWVFSEDIADRCALSEKERGDLAFAVQAKSVEYRLSHVERGLLAGVDLLMHGDAALDVHAAYVQLCERHQGLGEHVLLGDLVAYLGWPMLREKPGAYFSYLWSAAESATLHMSLASHARGAADGVARVAPSLLACLEPSAPSPPVPAAAAVSYYRQPAFTPSQ
jgi:oligopeptidase A